MVSLLLGASCSCRANETNPVETKPKRAKKTIAMNDDPLPKDEDDDDDDDEDGYLSFLPSLSSQLSLPPLQLC